jgi:hypothetical protein
VGGRTRIGGIAADERRKHRRDRNLPNAAVHAQKIRTGFNLPISHVPGPQAEMYWNGAHIEEIYPVSTVYDGLALNVTTCSYADRIGFGYAAGPEVVPDIDTLIPLTEQCLAELESAFAVTKRKRPRARRLP